MVEISGSFIREIFSAGIDFVKGAGEKIEKGGSQLSYSFVGKYKNRHPAKVEKTQINSVYMRSERRKIISKNFSTLKMTVYFIIYAT